MAVTGRTLALQRKLRARLDRILDQQLRDLTRAWVRAWDEVSLDLRDAIADALTSDNVTRGNLLRIERLRRSLAAVAEQLEDLAEQAQVRILTDLREVLDAAGESQAAIINSQLPPRSSLLVDLASWARIDPRQLDAMVRRTTQRITAQTRPLGQLADEVVRRELVRGMAAGSNPRTVARSMLRRAEQGFNGGLTRALTISRTELVDAHRAAAALGQAQHADVLQGWMWVAALSTRTCPSCVGQHGSIHELSEPGPLDHQQGRCFRMAVTRPWSELGINVDEPPSLVPDADSWFAGLSPDQQRQLLGPQGYAAWSSGAFPRSAWSQRRTSSGWRDSFVPAKPPLVPNRVGPSDHLDWVTQDPAKTMGLTASQTRHYTRGADSVLIDVDMTDAQANGLLNDVAAVLDAGRGNLRGRGVRVYVPGSDPKFVGGSLLGYVRRGEQVIRLSPRIARGEYSSTDPIFDQAMAAVFAVGQRRYTLGHELGHIVDALSGHTMDSRFQNRPAAAIFAALHAAGMSPYGQTRAAEAYAEAFVEWLLGDADLDVVKAYLAKYGWSRP